MRERRDERQRRKMKQRRRSKEGSRARMASGPGRWRFILYVCKTHRHCVTHAHAPRLWLFCFCSDISVCFCQFFVWSLKVFYRTLCDICVLTGSCYFTDIHNHFMDILKSSFLTSFAATNTQKYAFSFKILIDYMLFSYFSPHTTPYFLCTLQNNQIGLCRSKPINSSSDRQT